MSRNGSLLPSAEGLFDKKTGKSPSGGNSEPPKFILIPAYNDYIVQSGRNRAAWIEPLFDPKDGHMFRFEYVDEIARTLGREQTPMALDTEGKTYSLQPTIDRLTSLLAYNRQNYGMARVLHLGSDQFLPGRRDIPVLRVRLYPYRGYSASRSFDTIASMSVRNVGTAEMSGSEIAGVWLVHVSAIDGTHTRVGRFCPGPDGILKWQGHYPIRFQDELLVTVDLASTSRKGRTLCFELVVDPGKNAKAEEFAQQYGGDRFSPIQTVRNEYAQVIR